MALAILANAIRRNATQCDATQSVNPTTPPCRGGLVGRRSVAAAGVGGDSPTPQGLAVLQSNVERRVLVRELHGSVRGGRVLAVARGDPGCRRCWGGGQEWEVLTARNGGGEGRGEKTAMMGQKRPDTHQRLCFWAHLSVGF